MPFIIIQADNGRYILYIRAAKTLEVIATKDDKEGILGALKNFCSKFFTRSAMENYIKNFQSSNTENGIIYKIYNQQVEEEWNTLYKDIWEEKLESIIRASFKTFNGLKRKRFRVVI